MPTQVELGASGAASKDFSRQGGGHDLILRTEHPVLPTHPTEEATDICAPQEHQRSGLIRPSTCTINLPFLSLVAIPRHEMRSAMLGGGLDVLEGSWHTTPAPAARPPCQPSSRPETTEIFSGTLEANNRRCLSSKPRSYTRPLTAPGSIMSCVQSLPPQSPHPHKACCKAVAGTCWLLNTERNDTQ